MSIIFNSNTSFSVTVTRFSQAQYYNYTAHLDDCAWPVESLVPFDIIPHVQAFIADSTKNWRPLFRFLDPNDIPVNYGLHIVQQNDVITVYIAYDTPSMYDSYSIATFNISGIPSLYNVYFVYTNHPQQEDSMLYIIHGSTWDLAGVAPYTQPNQVRIMQQNALLADRPILECALGSDIPLPVTTGYANNEAFFPYYPYKVVKWTINGYTPVSNCVTTVIKTIRQGSIDLQYIYSIDNEEPITPVPDEPPFTPSQDDPYPTTPPTQDSSDEIPIPNMPTIGVTSAGFINVYNPGINALQGLGDIIFPNVASATDVTDAVFKLCQTLANQNLINYVLDCHVIPVTPSTTTNANIKIGFRDTGISVPVVQYDYVDATCGSLNIAEWFNGAADYSATNSKLYLPFVGFVDTKPEFWQAGTISVDYKFNVIDGSFMCYVRATSSKSNLSNTVIAQYAGNACMHLPLTGVNYAQMVSGIIGAGISAASGGRQQKNPVLGQGYTAAYSAANTIANGGDVQQSNGYNSTAALMGVRYPYLMIERAVPAFPKSYGHDKGYPSNITTNLGTVHGFTIIEDMDLSGIPFTSDELQELRQLLEEGVYF